jgi:DNA-binding transcriptional ArsR family regulator
VGPAQERGSVEGGQVAVSLWVDAPWSSHLFLGTSPLAELVCALHAANEPEHHPISHGWVERFEAASNGDLLARADRWGPLWDGFKARYFFPLSPGTEPDIGRELLNVARMPVDEFVAMTAQALVGENKIFTGDIADLSRPDGGAFMERMRLASHPNAVLGEWLVRDPVGMREELIAYLGEVVEEVFAQEWSLRRRQLEGEVQRKRRLAALEPWRVFEDMPQASVKIEERLIAFDVLYPADLRLSQSPLILIPTAHGSPHTTIKRYPGFPFIVQFPVLRRSDDEYVTVAEACRRLDVMTDPTRLIICRDIMRRPASTTELAQTLDMSVPQVSRHLRHLREAGLVVGNRSGSLVRYHLDLDAVRRIGLDLVDALLR